MRTLVTSTLDVLLARVKKPLLPNMYVHQAVRQFVTVCLQKGDMNNSLQSRRKLVSFLCTLCYQLRDDPSLAGVFFDGAPPGEEVPEFKIFSALLSVIDNSDLLHANSDRPVDDSGGSDDDTQQEAKQQQQQQQQQQQHQEQQSEEQQEQATEQQQEEQQPEEQQSEQNDLKMISSRGMAINRKLTKQALHGMLCCAQLPSVDITQFIVSQTEFIDCMVDRLVLCYQQLPTTLPDAESETIPELGEDPLFDQFFSQLALLDVVAGTTYQFVGRAVAESMRKRFLDFVVSPALLHQKETRNRCATVYVRHMIERCESQHMHLAFGNFLLGDIENDREPETEDESGQHPMRVTLIRRLDSLSEQLSIATLGLFDTLLGLRDQRILTNLVLRNLQDCRHIDAESRDYYRKRFSRSWEQFNDVDARSLMECFEGLADFTQDESFDAYLVDAQGEEQLWIRAIEHWADDDDNSNNNDAGNDDVKRDLFNVGDAEDHDENNNNDDDNTNKDEFYYEGLFMNTLLNKVMTWFQNSFSINLRLTSVLSKLAYCPHPLLHSFMLDPRLPVDNSTRLLLPLLSQVWQKGRKKAMAMPKFEERLRQAKQRLNQADSHTLETMDNEKFLHGMVVFEEFLKELNAICSAKNNLKHIHAMQQSAIQYDMMAAATSNLSLGAGSIIAAGQTPARPERPQRQDEQDNDDDGDGGLP
eukprot:TRINITY_DN65959_c7_g2_i1.p1 TRINITY_DN65959_c7_g2~~TRINITY_DN65959_c7_g2_i1.p1  ORF type:complete len:820 (-),score=468.45 TRINITY_DN65959_c7_g2_i1:757-2856(-)